MKMASYLPVCLLVGAGVCLYACKTSKGESGRAATDAVAGATVQANDRPHMQAAGRPDGPPPGGMGMPPGGHFDEGLVKAALMVAEGETVRRGEEIRAAGENESAVVAKGTGKVELRGNTITTSGNTTSQDHSSFQGLNAGVLGRDEAEIRLSGNRISTSGLGANAIFACGKSIIYSDGDVINCTGDGGHGIMCSGGGTIHAVNVDITTSGKNAAPVATDRGGGTITVGGGRIVSHGQDSPGLYSTGRLILSGVDIASDGAEVAVIEGSNQIRLDSCRLACSFARKWGIMVYQSFSGDAEGADGEFEAAGSAIHVTGEDSPLFFVTNSTAYIALDGNDIRCVSGILLDAAASRWGRQGENGGTAVITARRQVLEGSLLADADSRIRLHLTEGSLLKGTVNPGASAKAADVFIDKDSRWELSQDAYVSVIEADMAEDGGVANITGNGHDLYYDAARNPSLGGKAYPLQGGGEMKANK